MTNHIKAARETVDAVECQNIPPEMVELAKAHALIAIAEELRRINGAGMGDTLVVIAKQLQAANLMTKDTTYRFKKE